MRLLALLTLLLAAPGAPAQDPDDEPRYDPAVTPAQFTQPGRVAPPGESGGGGAVADPATPVVRIQVRAPAHLAPGKPLVYRVTVTNTSSATAYRVVVRHPFPEGVNAPPVAEPQPEPPAAGAKEMTWKHSELQPGATKEITLTYTMQPDAKSVTAKAFVGFEHGQAVTTDPEKPKVTVTKSAPEKANGTEPIPVRIRVKNVSRVPVKDLDVVETISPGFEYVADGDGEPTNVPGQRTWRVRELAPGQTRTIEYRVRAKGKAGAEFATTSNVKSGDVKGITDPATSVTKVLTPDLRLDLTGPATKPLDEPAEYTVTVTNTGNTTLNSVRVVADVPADCTVKKMTNGGRRTRDQLIWDVPGDRKTEPLGPGDPYTLRFTLVGGRAGAKKVAVNADGGRGVEQAREVTTTFTGVAALKYRVELEPGVVVAGNNGMVRYVVRNPGSRDAKNVVLRVNLPANVEARQTTPPRTNAAGGKTEFEPQTVLVGGEISYAITYTARTPGRAAFKFELFADGEATPLTAEKSVTIEPASP